MDAIKLADSFIQIKGSAGKMYRMSECQNDIVAYQRLTDSVFERIQESDNQKAVDLLDRILKRDLYKMVAEIKLSPGRPNAKFLIKCVTNTRLGHPTRSYPTPPKSLCPCPIRPLSTKKGHENTGNPFPCNPKIWIFQDFQAKTQLYTIK